MTLLPPSPNAEITDMHCHIQSLVAKVCARQVVQHLSHVPTPKLLGHHCHIKHNKYFIGVSHMKLPNPVILRT